MKNNNPTKEALKVTKKFNAKEIKSDVTGSYTGIPEDHEKPIQDADDL